MEADPINATTPAMRRSHNHAQFWLSWKTWMAACILSLAVSAGSVALPFYRRWEAITYLDDHSVRYGLKLTGEVRQFSPNQRT